jgi:hypothetical protein
MAVDVVRFAQSRIVAVALSGVPSSRLLSAIASLPGVVQSTDPEDAIDTSLLSTGVISFKMVPPPSSVESIPGYGSVFIAEEEQMFGTMQTAARCMRGTVAAPPPRAWTPPPAAEPVAIPWCTQNLPTTGELRNLDRLDDPAREDQRFVYGPCGVGWPPAHVFVLDTGVFNHDELAGRRSGVSACMLTAFGTCSSAGEPWSDDNGHGTHCAGAAMGSLVGVSKSAVVHSVKILTAKGAGSTSSLLAGMRWVAAMVSQDASLRPAVVSMSLTGGVSDLVDGTVTTLVSAGIPVVVAAGNSFDDACKYSPARAVTAVTVAAANLSPLQLANFSNYGSCVDVILPGVDVLSSINQAGAYGLSSGTSMATAHAAGVIASMLSASPCLSPASVASLLASSSSPLMTSLPSGTPNRLVNSTAAILAAAAHKC